MTTQPERRPNRLLAETSPYLQQHAYNPVDWYPWGEEALRRSRELDRPIFLSVGYSTCHWCHVMERESFENEEIARLLNESFVSIKVDREERPDIDATYMSAVQMLTGSGGWPMSVFLTPELKPFWGGTYFPPRDLHGRPGFPRILTQIAEVYRTQRERVEESAQEITSHLVEVPAPPSANELPGDEILEAAVDHARRTFDPGHGGFGSAPKFPRSIELSKLLRYHRRTGDEQVLAMVEKTLDGMANGGIHDQIGGGFHRYSTDDRWLVPHFEKMLYDNALLARVYLEGFQATGAPRHAAIARDIFEYVAREMTHPEGAFYSATDADSEGEEGKFFVWTPAQVEEVLGREDARIVCESLGITREGNFEHGTSIPHVPRSLDVVARLLKLEPGEAVRGIERGIPLLRKARERRIKPFRDEKILAAWNGLMISAFARGAQVLGEPRYLEIAERAAGDLVARLCVGGRLHRIHKDGKTRVPGFLDDLAFVAEAFLDLYETSFRISHLVRARELADQMLAELWDPVGRAFFFTAQHHEALLSRRKDLLDNATPSGNGVAALVLLRLERLTGAEAYRDRAIELLKSLRPLLERAPMAMSSAILALEFNPPLELALAGDPTSPRGRALLQAAHRQFLPARVVAAALPGEEEAACRAIPLLRGKVPVSGEPALHVCRDYACQAPVTTPEAVTALLQPSR